MTNQQTKRILLIGLGDLGQLIEANYLHKYEIVSYDVNSDTLPTTTNFDDVCNMGTFDLAVVSVPISMYFQYVTKLTKFCKRILVENIHDSNEYEAMVSSTINSDCEILISNPLKYKLADIVGDIKLRKTNISAVNVKFITKFPKQSWRYQPVYTKLGSANNLRLVHGIFADFLDFKHFTSAVVTVDNFDFNDAQMKVHDDVIDLLVDSSSSVTIKSDNLFDMVLNCVWDDYVKNDTISIEVVYSSGGSTVYNTTYDIKDHLLEIEKLLEGIDTESYKISGIANTIINDYLITEVLQSSMLEDDMCCGQNCCNHDS